MTLSLLLAALQCPELPSDPAALARCVAFLEDAKVRALPPAARDTLRQGAAPEWPAAFGQVRRRGAREPGAG